MDKLVLVTGASRNIGKSIAKKFLDNEYHVIGTYNSSPQSEIKKYVSSFQNLDMFQVDFCKSKNVDNFINEMRKYQFDIIINNAGMMNLDINDNIVNEFSDFELSSFERVMSCNFYAPLQICIGLKDNIKAGGSIVNIASTDGMQATYASLSYSASKAALINLTASLSNSFYPKKKVRVNSVSPGWIAPDEKGDMNAGPESPSNKAQLLTPLNRNGKTYEVADLVYFLTQAESSFINGTNIVIDGGFSNHDVIYYEEATGKSLLKTEQKA